MPLAGLLEGGVAQNKWVLAGLGAAAGYMLLPRRKKQYYDTGFDSFLKQEVPEEEQGFTFDAFLRVRSEPDSCDFSSFLKGSTAAAPAAAAKPAPGKRVPSAEELAVKKRVIVMFGTEYGFAKEIAEKLCEQLEAHDSIWPVLINMADYPEGYDFSKEQAAFMICSTQGDGVPPTEARDFCEWLFACKAGQLRHLQYSVCALGDTSYTHFCRCGKQLDAAMAAAGAAQAVPRTDVNKEDWPVVNQWLDAVCQAVLAAPLKTAAAMGIVADAGAHKAAVKRWGKARPYYARVAAVQGLCRLSSKEDKETVRAELDLGDSGLEYLPGDALGIYAANAPQAVDELLALLGADGQQQVPIPSWHYEESEAARQGYSDTRMPLRQALLKCYDLRSPKPELLQLLLAALPSDKAAAATWADEQETAPEADQIKAGGGAGGGHAAAHAEPAGKGQQAAQKLCALLADAGALDKYLAQRHVVDILQEFAPAALAADKVLPALRQLQPRLYSISSSPLEDAKGVQATIAVVRYEALAKERIGVCSTYVAERLEVGASVPVFISKNPDFRLPKDPQTPILMVGPGTGLAPFRSFILQRHLQAQQQGSTCGQMVLYFGCRRSDQDYLYGGDLEAWHAAGTITLFTAFSRMPGQPKVYVQQRLRESADLVWQLLEAGGHFYVCGDAGSMAGQVEEALLGIIEQHQGQGDAAARQYLEQLSQSERYQRDVWFS